MAGHEPEPPPDKGLPARPPSDEDIELAVEVLARHVPEQWPYGIRCRDCHWPHPCAAKRLANAVLIRAGLLDGPVQLPPVEPASDATGVEPEPLGDSPPS